ncbi:GntR family transcriptional regulator [Boseongicola aestuarii]|uniref:Putative HTH-type transcriptional regulator YdfH n=1 Tax=Boseongicola aestuarii TaxID=1470561 RepID=A0A238IZJ0_9RHOB|nr:GntR family transcriptional regulator [Boseongicola aestuarii]SMX23461.1 putative HTH-type transcriptional regulator YdfH [Boseongicola aestuarii]
MKSVKSISRTDEAYARLKDDIRANCLAPGHLEPEPELAARLGMSRTPVHEALIRLEAEGLVEIVPRRGARVLPISADDMREIYEILTALEPEAAACLAARQPSEKEIDPLDQATQDMTDALDKGDLDRWVEADDRFHQTLLRLHGNKRLAAFVGALFDQSHRARMVTLRLREPPIISTAEHRIILEFLRRGDAEGTREAFRKHRQRTSVELISILEDYRLPHL